MPTSTGFDGARTPAQLFHPKVETPDKVTDLQYEQAQALSSRIYPLSSKTRLTGGGPAGLLPSQGRATYDASSAQAVIRCASMRCEQVPISCSVPTVGTEVPLEASIHPRVSPAKVQVPAQCLLSGSPFHVRIWISAGRYAGRVERSC